MHVFLGYRCLIIIVIFSFLHICVPVVILVKLLYNFYDNKILMHITFDLNLLKAIKFELKLHI